MGIYEHLSTFAGLPVRDFDPEQAPDGQGGSFAWRFRSHFEFIARRDPPFTELLDRFLDQFGDTAIALVIGLLLPDVGGNPRQGSADLVPALVAARQRLPNLRHLFVGDITAEECEISWIEHGDLSALVPALPQLEEFVLRGASRVTFGKLAHPNLKRLAVESGGLPAELLTELWTAELPQLTSLELWLGSQYYGGITDSAALQPLLAGGLFPRLIHLGLRNSDMADEVAAAVAASPILERLHTLDLSLGNLSDAGAAALLTSHALGKLKKLDLHHHYLSAEMINRFQQLNIEVDLTADTDGDDDYRYNAVSE